MKRHSLVAVAALIAVGVPAGAQTYQRRADLRGPSRDGEGKCTIEVFVDGAAEVAVRGDTAILRNLSGRPPQWRRFVCSTPMPPNPANFRFSGVDGRGRQELIRDPRDGGAAVVRIEDPDNGAEGYTFDLTWDGNFYPGEARPIAPRYQGGGRRDYPDEDVYHTDRDSYFRRENWQGRFFERVREDLEHVQAATFPGGGDLYRLARTRQELDELQEQSSRGRFDRRELDDVIGAMRNVLRDNRLTNRDRDVLSDDLRRLNEFRERRDY